MANKKTGEQQEIEIDGTNYKAIRHPDGKFRLFRPGAPDDDKARLPGEKGRCSYCLGPDTHLSEGGGEIICEDCDEVEVIIHGEAESVGEMKQYTN